jgi:hypothetical protein
VVQLKLPTFNTLPCQTVSKKILANLEKRWFWGTNYDVLSMQVYTGTMVVLFI